MAKSTAPRAARGALKKAVAELLASDPSRAWRFEEVADALPHLNQGSVFSALSDGHRNSGSPIHRVAAGTYTWNGDDLVTKVQRMVPTTPTDDTVPEMGMMFEVVGYFRGQVILVDSLNENDLWLCTPKMLHLDQ